jgi:hypothetical protein
MILLGRIEVLRELLELVQEKDAEGDQIAAEVLLWAHKRLVNSITNVVD